MAIEGIVDPARAVNGGVLGGVDEDSVDGLGRGLDNDARADNCGRHGYWLLSHVLELDKNLKRSQSVTLGERHLGLLVTRLRSAGQ